ncbi:ABC transporter permease [Paenibacillus contaminans]|uniref:ABC transporter permease n=1 Tax=Paenibacillus contaminans TaxID=450362 RepID=A0A329MP42_9BACL|nr:ABC transporter permease [Paenibacillus contaminans]RAV21731.1 ABC transporter permease [Paenibacillus contaminans]
MNWRRKLINPVLEKEFRLRMRTVRSSLAVSIYLVAMTLLAFGFMYMTMFGGGAAVFNPQRSQELFYFLSGAQMVLITFMVPGLTAGVISGEREKQTLNILLTTQQSSTTIILSKLFSSLSFMLVVIIATLPLYSIVFLFGGVSPVQLIAVFLFYMFVMLLLGSIGVFVSTVFKKTMVAVIVTYGFAVFIYGFTGLAAIFLAQTFFRGSSYVPGLLLGLNPMGALISVFNPDFSHEVFNRQTNLQLWHIFIPLYSVVTAVALWLSIAFLRPRMKRG